MMSQQRPFYYSSENYIIHSIKSKVQESARQPIRAKTHRERMKHIKNYTRSTIPKWVLVDSDIER
jgi:hypothetical protein